MDNRTLIEQFFAQERISKRNITIVLWGIVILTDIFALIAYLHGVERLSHCSVPHRSARCPLFHPALVQFASKQNTARAINDVA